MPLELVTIPCLKDNYAYLLHDAETDATTLIDAPEPGPILAVLKPVSYTHLDVYKRQGNLRPNPSQKFEVPSQNRRSDGGAKSEVMLRSGVKPCFFSCAYSCPPE